jgi:hypothetical protein
MVAVLALMPTFALANSGDASGAVAIGTGYAGIVTAPTNGLVVRAMLVLARQHLTRFFRSAARQHK